MSAKKQRITPKHPHKSSKKEKRPIAQIISSVKAEEDQTSNWKSRRISNVKKDIAQQYEVICLDDEIEIVSGLIPSKKQKKQMEMEVKKQAEMEKIQAESVMVLQANKMVEFIIEPRTDQCTQITNLQRVVRLNHFFKWQGEIYFEVIIGCGQQVFRQPQLMTFQALRSNKQTRFMVYEYIKQICMKKNDQESQQQKKGKFA